MGHGQGPVRSFENRAVVQDDTDQTAGINEEGQEGPFEVTITVKEVNEKPRRLRQQYADAADSQVEPAMDISTV